MKLNPIIYILVVILVLGGLFLVFKPQNQTSVIKTTPTPSEQISSPSATPTSNIKTFKLEIEDKKLVLGEELIQVIQGDDITLKITSDEADEFHIHGYNKFVDLKPNQQMELKFTTNINGRFIMELEHSKTEIGALEVLPKQ